MDFSAASSKSLWSFFGSLAYSLALDSALAKDELFRTLLSEISGFGALIVRDFLVCGVFSCWLFDLVDFVPEVFLAEGLLVTRGGVGFFFVVFVAAFLAGMVVSSVGVELYIRLDQSRPSGEEFLHHALLEGAGLVPPLLQRRQLQVHVGENGGDGGLFGNCWRS